MSGPICPDCDLLAVKEIGPNKMMCPICGWEGETLPRKRLRHDMHLETSQETSRQLKLREEGRLTYFRVYLRGTDDQKYDALFEIMELMELSRVSGGERVLFHIEEKVSPEKVDAIRSLKGVKEVEVY